MALVTLAEGKAHLQVTSSDADGDLTIKLAAAEAAILSYCGSTAYWQPIVAAWTSGTVPPAVKAAILLQLGELDQFRGQETQGPVRYDDRDFSPAIQSLLRPWHDPTLV
jgi:hypothetical protein